MLGASRLSSKRSYLSIELQPLWEGDCLMNFSDLAENIQHILVRTESDLKNHDVVA